MGSDNLYGQGQIKENLEDEIDETSKLLSALKEPQSKGQEITKHSTNQHVNPDVNRQFQKFSVQQT